MKRIILHILLIAFLGLLSSCVKENVSADLLKQAQSIIESNPSNALILIDSIHNPEDMGTDNYMQYIVVRTQAKYKVKQNMINEKLIFDAQEYFQNSKNVEMAALANYYAGCVYRDNKIVDRSLESFLQADYYASKAKNNKLLGKIFENIGTLYLNQNVIDSALINYKKADAYYYKVNDTLSIIRTINQIGLSFEAKNELDSAYYYFDRVLNMADKLNNDNFKSKATQNLALVCYKLGQYQKSINYYVSASEIPTINDENRRQINLHLLNIYNKTGDLNSAKKYVEKIKTDLSKVSYLHTVKEMYEALSNYYKLTGDYKQALFFNDLKCQTIDLIGLKERPLEIMKADAKFRVKQQDRFYEELQFDFYFYITIGTIVFIIIIMFFVITVKQNKREREDIQHQIDRYSRMRRDLASMNDNYTQIEDEIKAMLEDDDEVEKVDDRTNHRP